MNISYYIYIQWVSVWVCMCVWCIGYWVEFVVDFLKTKKITFRYIFFFDYHSRIGYKTWIFFLFCFNFAKNTCILHTHINVHLIYRKKIVSLKQKSQKKKKIVTKGVRVRLQLCVVCVCVLSHKLMYMTLDDDDIYTPALEHPIHHQKKKKKKETWKQNVENVVFGRN